MSHQNGWWCDMSSCMTFYNQAHYMKFFSTIVEIKTKEKRIKIKQAMFRV